MTTNAERTSPRITERQALQREAHSLLPSADAAPEIYENHLDRLFAGPGATTELLMAVLAELWRRLDSVGDAGHGAEGAAERVEDELIGRRSGRRLEQLERRDLAEPLRRRLLHRLASRASTPTALAASVLASKEAVSRALARLEEEGLVEAQADPDDRRRRVYSLTRAGGIERREQMALPVPRGQAERQRIAAARPFLEGALREAVERRRHANDLPDAVERFRRIKSEARKAGAWDLELRARRELATTLRQASLDREFDSEVREMAEIAGGRDPQIDPSLVVPARAHVAYELGRQGRDHRDEHLLKRVIRLVTADEIFSTLWRDGVAGDNWQARQAWALFGLGDTRRLQTQFGHALADATRALRLFTELGDDYGAASSLLLAGVCLRLRGQFAESLAVLDLACARAFESRFFRLQADSLMQLGEVNRSVGRLDQAEKLLSDAISCADELKSAVTGGFARSSLAAAVYERGRYDDARRLFADAHALFTQRNHHAGLALNLHRQAILCGSLQSAHRGADDARDLLRRTRRRYDRLRSPAGVVACYIEEGRLALEAGKRLTADWRRRLLDSIAPIKRRELLEKDPWVPAMLSAFAQALGDERLIAVSHTVVRGSADRRVACQEEWVKANAVFAVSVPTELSRDEPDAMAGEHRRLVSAIP
jgi:DNA-binding MarR family transcriptional regulator